MAKDIEALGARINACKAAHGITDADILRARIAMRRQRYAEAIGRLLDMTHNLNSAMLKFRHQLEAVSVRP